MTVLLETYRAGDVDVHEYVSVERLSTHNVSTVPLWAAKQ